VNRLLTHHTYDKYARPITEHIRENSISDNYLSKTETINLILKRTAVNVPLCERIGRDKLLQTVMKSVLVSNAGDTMSWAILVKKSVLLDGLGDGRVLYVVIFIICL
jgi:hypothetical protein